MKNNLEKIAIDVDGELIVSTNRHLSGDPEIIKKIRENSILERQVQLVSPHGQLVVAALGGSALQVVAAIISAAPGRSHVLAAPQEVLSWLDRQIDVSHEDLTEDSKEVAIDFVSPEIKEEVDIRDV